MITVLSSHEIKIKDKLNKKELLSISKGGSVSEKKTEANFLKKIQPFVEKHFNFPQIFQHVNSPPAHPRIGLV